MQRSSPRAVRRVCGPLARLAAVAIVFAALIWVLALIPGAILLAVAETWEGRVAGATSFVIFAALVLAVPALARPTRTRARRAFVLGGASALGLLVLAAATPSGESLAGSGAASRYLGPRSYPRFAIANLVPEIDQILVGTYLIPLVDPLTDARRARHVRVISMALYRPMQADPEYRTLGSAMEYAYEDSDSGHIYSYVPPHIAGEKLPVLLFLHGSAGNFGAYFYLLRRVADASHVILVCPSFGFGNWDEPGGVDAIERARAYATTTLPGDSRRVVLAGLSNGGRGVTRAAVRAPNAYAGYIFFSAVMEPAVMHTSAFARAVAGKPVLVVHGADDERIALAHAGAAVSTLRAEGARVAFRVYPREDHFLVFSQPGPVLDDATRYLASSGLAGLQAGHAARADRSIRPPDVAALATRRGGQDR